MMAAVVVAVLADDPGQLEAWLGHEGGRHGINP
jgi:hypothetical protein